MTTAERAENMRKEWTYERKCKGFDAFEMFSRIQDTMQDGEVLNCLWGGSSSGWGYENWKIFKDNVDFNGGGWLKDCGYPTIRELYKYRCKQK